MIIVSQDKNAIVNFDNVIGIKTAIDIESNKERLIAIDTIDSERYYIAKYSTEERAKEVLREIISMYQGSLLLQYTNNKAQEDIAKLFKDMDITPFKFEMPQE